MSAVAEVGYTEIDLPMNEVARFLARARVDLHHHREQAADAELRDAQDSVMIFFGHASIDVEDGSISAVSVGPRR